MPKKVLDSDFRSLSYFCPVFDYLQYRITESRNTRREMPNYFFFSHEDQATVCVLVLLGYSHIANLACTTRRNYICTVLQNMISYFALLSVEPCLSIVLHLGGGLNPPSDIPGLSGESGMLSIQSN